MRVGEHDVIGYILAWCPEGRETYNFTFFGSASVTGKVKTYTYSPFTEFGEQETMLNLSAKERAETELGHMLGGIKKYGMRVIDGYVLPVRGPLRIQTPNMVEIS